MEHGVPTYAYDYETAVQQDHVLVPYYNYEVKTRFLEEGISYDDLSEEDKERYEDDFIEDSYIMEISSPGLDRPLKKEKDFARSIGKLVEIRTYRPIEKQKEFCGELTAYDNNSVTIDEEGTPRTFDKKDIALVRLAIDF